MPGDPRDVSVGSLAYGGYPAPILPVPIAEGGTAAVGLIDSEVPAGTIDGMNTAFTLAHPPQSDAILHVYSDGLRTTAFTRVGTALTMSAAPVTSLLVDYRY